MGDSVTSNFIVMASGDWERKLQKLTRRIKVEKCIVLVISLLMNAMYMGFLAGQGVLFVDILHTFQSTRAMGSLIQAVSQGVIFGAGAITALGVSRFGAGRVCIVGGFMASIGCIGSAFAPDIGTLVVTGGLVTGIGLCTASIIPFCVVGNFFNKHRHAAFSISFLGSGIGILVFPVINQFLLEELGWRGTFLILAGMLLHLCPAGMMLTNIQRDIQSFNKLKESHKSTNESGCVKEASADDGINVSSISNDVVDKSVLSNYAYEDVDIAHEIDCKRQRIDVENTSFNNACDIHTSPFKEGSKQSGGLSYLINNPLTGCNSSNAIVENKANYSLGENVTELAINIGFIDSEHDVTELNCGETYKTNQVNFSAKKSENRSDECSDTRKSCVEIAKETSDSTNEQFAGVKGKSILDSSDSGCTTLGNRSKYADVDLTDTVEHISTSGDSKSKELNYVCCNEGINKQTVDSFQCDLNSAYTKLHRFALKWHLELFTEFSFILIAIFNFLLISLFSHINFFFVDMAISKGIDARSASFLLALVGFCNVGGRLVYLLFVVPLWKRSPIPVIATTSLVLSLCILLLTLADTYTFLLVAVVCYGVPYGMTAIGYPSVLFEISGSERYPERYPFIVGYTETIAGLLGLVAGPIAGSLKDSTNSYDGIIYCTSAVGVFCCISLYAIYYKRFMNPKHKTSP